MFSDAIILRNSIKFSRQKDIENKKKKEQELMLSHYKSSSLNATRKIASLEESKKEMKATYKLEQHKACWWNEHLHLKEAFNATDAQLALITKKLDLPTTLEFKINQDDIATRQQVLDSKNGDAKSIYQLSRKISHVINALEDEIKKLEFNMPDTWTLDLDRIHDPFITIDVKSETLDNNVILLSEAQFIDPELSRQKTLLHKELKSQFESKLNCLREAYDDVLKCKWPIDSYRLFVKIFNEYSRQSMRNLLMDRLKMEFPFYSEKQFIDQFTWHNRHVSFKKQKNAIINNFEDVMKEFTAETIRQILREREITLCEDHEQEKREQLLLKMERNNQKLREWREHRKEQMLMIQERHKQEHEEAMKQIRELKEKEAADRKEKQERLNQYYEKLEKYKINQQEMSTKIAFIEQAEKIVQKKLNEERILFRRMKRNEKLIARQQELDKIKREKANLEERLNKLKKTVAVEVKSDWERIFDDTIAFAEHKKTKQEHSWFEPRGFSIEKLMQDDRMKLSIALNKQGLNQTNYARQILISMEPKAKPQLISNIKLG